MTPQTASQTFLRRLFVTQPQLSGWPPWVDLRQAGGADAPYVYEDVWEAYIDTLGRRAVIIELLDFWRADPKGVFYHTRTLETDMMGPPHAPPPGTILDPKYEIRAVTEAIAVGLSFARAMGCETSSTSLAFGFRWCKLKDRVLAYRTGGRWPDASSRAVQDTAVTTTSVPLETPTSGIAPHVGNAVRGLFVLFGGTEYDERTMQRIIDEQLSGRA